MLVRTLANKCQKPGASWLLQKRNLWQLWLGPRTEGWVTELEGYQDPVALFIFCFPYQPSLIKFGCLFIVEYYESSLCIVDTRPLSDV